MSKVIRTCHPPPFLDPLSSQTELAFLCRSAFLLSFEQEFLTFGLKLALDFWSMLLHALLMVRVLSEHCKLARG
jgi:hypothetical protein